MRNVLLSILFGIVAGLIFASVHSVSAATNGSYNMSCFKITNIYVDSQAQLSSPACQKLGYPCVLPPAGFTWPGQSHDHTVKIQGSIASPNQQVYVVSCVGTDDDTRCTAGSPEANKAVKSMGFALEPDPTHQFSVAGGNPVQATSTNLTVAVRSYTSEGQNHKFFGVYTEAPKLTNEGKGNTLQYGTFEFIGDPGTCTGIFWDPKGRTFDSKSLEPVPETSVRLYALKDDVKTLINPGPPDYPGVKDNPLKTRFNGLFEFFVPNGTYFLEPEKPGYTFPVNLSSIDPNYTKAYYCDKPVGHPIYNEQYPIVEENRVIHCDIPIDPGTNPPYRSEPVIKKYSVVNIPGGTSMQFSGLVSHPLSIITLVGQTTNKEYARSTANRLGQWQFNVLNSKLPVDEAVVVKPIKVNLTNKVAARAQSLFETILDKLVAVVAPQVKAQAPTDIVVQPILRYIEGFAYDTNGQSLPNTTVELRLEMSDETQAVTTTDEKGHFVFYPNEIPIFSYYLSYSTPQSSAPLKITTSQFAKQNEAYLAENKISLQTATKDGDAVPTRIVTAVPTQYVPPSPTSVAVASQRNNSSTLLILLVLLLVFALGTGFFMLRKAKGATTPPVPPPPPPQP